MKSLAVLFLLVFIVSCGGGSDGSGGDPDLSSNSGSEGATNNDSDDSGDECTIITNEIQLSDGESCELTEAQATPYSVSPGLVECAGGVVIYGNSQFQSGENGITFNGLTFICN